MPKKFTHTLQFTLTLLIFLSYNSVFAFDLNCSEPESAATECTIPSNFDIDIIADGDITWSDLISNVSPDEITKSIRISGGGKVTVEDSDVLLKSSDAILVLDGIEFIVNNGNVLLDESDSKIILNETTFRITGNLQLKEKTFLCATNCTMEIGDERADGNFNDDGEKYTSANFQNDGGYRYLENVCLNVTQDYQLESSGDGTASGGGLDIWKNVCAEIGDAGKTNASDHKFGKKDGDDSGNFQNSNTMKIYDSEIVVANGNFQNQSSSEIGLCNVGVKLNNGSFQNDGDLNGMNLVLAIQDELQDDGSWTAEILDWYAGSSNSAPNNNPSESNKKSILKLFGDCDCTPVVPIKNSILPIPDVYEIYSTEIAMGNVIPNDIDPEGDNIIYMGVEDPNLPLSYITDGFIVEAPGVTTEGVALDNAGIFYTQPDGSFIFQPVPFFIGTVVLNYEICDDNPNVACDITTLTIIVKTFGGGGGFDLAAPSLISNSSSADEQNIRSQNNSSFSNNELNVFPNPVRRNQKLFVNIKSEQKSSDVRMLNMTGEVVKVFNAQAAADQQLEIDVTNLPNGIYHIVVDGGRMTKKVVVMK